MSKKIAKQIVKCVRKKITDDLVHYPENDPWDEEFAGAAWLENEVEMAVDLLKIVRPSAVIPAWNDCTTVSLFQEKLQTLSKVDLSLIWFVVVLGGSSEPAFFELRDKSKEEILTWFKNRGFVMLNRICSLCHTQGKMKKCSICLQTYYCSAECQKKDWKNHKASCKKDE